MHLVPVRKLLEGRGVDPVLSAEFNSGGLDTITICCTQPKHSDDEVLFLAQHALMTLADMNYYDAKRRVKTQVEALPAEYASKKIFTCKGQSCVFMNGDDTAKLLRVCRMFPHEHSKYPQKVLHETGAQATESLPDNAIVKLADKKLPITSALRVNMPAEALLERLRQDSVLKRAFRVNKRDSLYVEQTRSGCDIAYIAHNVIAVLTGLVPLKALRLACKLTLDRTRFPSLRYLDGHKYVLLLDLDDVIVLLHQYVCAALGKEKKSLPLLSAENKHAKHSYSVHTADTKQLVFEWLLDHIEFPFPDQGELKKLQHDCSIRDADEMRCLVGNIRKTKLQRTFTLSGASHVVSWTAISATVKWKHPTK